VRGGRRVLGRPSLTAEAWAGGLEQRDGGWWPRFDVDVMTRTLREAVSRSYWAQWERIACPTLVVRAGAGSLSPPTRRRWSAADVARSSSSWRAPSTTCTWTAPPSGARR
jgi:pimeloyl-ACP methyl ester carboxylesterase